MTNAQIVAGKRSALFASEYDVVIIGAGPGGYVCAIRAAQLGLRVACVEKGARLGGTCLNVGCIPSKVMLESSERYAELQHGLLDHGIVVAPPTLDLPRLHQRREQVVAQLTGGVDLLFKKHKVTRFVGHGRIAPRRATGAWQVVVTDGEGAETIVATQSIVLATGSVPSSLRGVSFDHERIVDSTGALAFPKVPEHLILIGAGVIGLELGSVWLRLGAKVTVLEYLDRILAGVDREVADEAQKVLTKQGLEFVLGARVQSVVRVGDRVDVTWTDAENKFHVLAGDYALVAVGRRPRTDELGLTEANVALDPRGRIVVDDELQTSAPGIFAIGDCIRGPMLAHKAEEEGIAVAEILAGETAHVGYDAIPSIVYTHPEVAGVGKTEEELSEAGIPYVKGRFKFAPNGRALALGDAQGFVKILAHKETDRVLGAHIIGPRAGDLIAELAMAINFGASAEDVARTCHAHPTLSEVVWEAALDCARRSLHK